MCVRVHTIPHTLSPCQHTHLLFPCQRRGSTVSVMHGGGHGCEVVVVAEVGVVVAVEAGRRMIAARAQWY